MPASNSCADLLSIEQVEVLALMKRSNIYRLIKLGLFPAPIHMGGSKWSRAEVEECIQRRKDERDRQIGGNKFTPRPAILSGEGTDALNGSSPDGKPETVAGPNPSTFRMLAPELCQALRMLKLDIPELYLDPNDWDVTLAVITVRRSPVQQPKTRPKAKKR